jgi:hypothetical protein
MGSNPSLLAFPIMPTTQEPVVGDSVPSVGQVVSQVATAVFPVIASLAAPYLYREAVSRLPQAIQIGNGMMHEGVAIVVRKIDSVQQYIRGLSTIDAARSGSVERVRALLDGGLISDKDRGEAIVEAMRIFLKQYHNTGVMQESYPQIVRLLLNSGEISNEDRALAVTDACRTAHTEILRSLLDSGEIDQDSLGWAVRWAVWDRKYPCASLLLSYGLIGEHDRSTAFGFDSPLEIKNLLSNSADCAALFMEGPRFRDYQNQVLNNIEANPAAFTDAIGNIPQWQNSREFILAAAARNGLILQYIPEDQRSIEIIAAAVVQNPEARRWIPHIREEQSAIEFIAAAIVQNPEARRWVPQALSDQAFDERDTNPQLFPLWPENEITVERAQRAIQDNHLFLRFIPVEIQAGIPLNDLQFAVMRNPEAINLIDPAILQSGIIDAVIQVGLDTPSADLKAACDRALRILVSKAAQGQINQQVIFDSSIKLSQFFKNDSVILLYLMTVHGVDFSIASDELKNNADVVLAAVRIHQDNFAHASARLKNSPDFIGEAAACNGLILQFVPEELINPFIVQTAIGENPLVLTSISAERQYDMSSWVFTSAVKKNPEALNLIAPSSLQASMINKVIEMGIDPAVSADLKAACDRALRIFANKVLEGTIDRQILSRSILGITRFFKNDRAIVLYAMTQYGISLSVASDELKDNEDVVLAAVRIDRANWAYASQRLRENPTPAITQVLEEDPV